MMTPRGIRLILSGDRHFSALSVGGLFLYLLLILLLNYYYYYLRVRKARGLVGGTRRRLYHQLDSG